MEPTKTVTIPLENLKRIIGRLDLLGLDLFEMIPTIQCKKEREKMLANTNDLSFIVNWIIEQTGQEIDLEDAGDLAMHGMTTAERMIAEINDEIQC
jgi:hypothetical protein